MEALEQGEKIRVYVAGPLTKGDTLKNISTAIHAGNDLLKRGFIPFIPHLNSLWEIVCSEHPVSTWLEYDKQWIRACHALLRLEGESPGADGEVEFCNERNIPVFHRISDIERHFFKTSVLI